MVLCRRTPSTPSCHACGESVGFAKSAIWRPLLRSTAATIEIIIGMVMKVHVVKVLY
jgi:uncharacterized protein (DUF983 family)